MVGSQWRIVKDVTLPLQKQAQEGATHQYFQYISIQSVLTTRIYGGLMRILLRYTYCVSPTNRPESVLRGRITDRQKQII